MYETITSGAQTPSPAINVDPSNDKLVKLLNEKKSARAFQDRKHADWNENYELYRNKVKTNRLTQRQAVNIPLMRETIKTLISKVDDTPTVEWQEKSGDEMKQIIYQELWNEFVKKNKWEWQDILDKKNVFLYGLSTKKLNLGDNCIDMEILDVFDVVYDPLTNPLDIETARFIVQQNIYRPLREILADERYSKEGRDELKNFMATDKGIVQSANNKVEADKKNERLRAMGVDNDKFPLFAGGDVIVNLTEHYTSLWNTKTKSFERRVVVYADDRTELLDEKLEDLIGINMWPFIMWMEDPETNDIYPDGVADLIRTPNKILNVWFSQMVENRTLQNFQMHWFDATIQGYQPQTYEPGPGRMLPAPGDPSKTIMPVQINGLDETLTAIDFLVNVVERGTGATALEKGEPEQGAQTLGEVEILVGKATERAKTMAKFYRLAGHDLAVKWDALMQNNPYKKMTLYKTGTNGKVFEKVVYQSDWKSEAGYVATVASSSEQEAEESKSIAKWGFVLQQFPNNSVLRKLAQKRELSLLDLTPVELKEVQEEEERMMEMMQQQQQMQMQQAQAQGALPQQMAQEGQELTATLDQQLGQLQGL